MLKIPLSLPKWLHLTIHEKKYCLGNCLFVAPKSEIPLLCVVVVGFRFLETFSAFQRPSFLTSVESFCCCSTSEYNSVRCRHLGLVISGRFKSVSGSVSGIFFDYFSEIRASKAQAPEVMRRRNQLGVVQRQYQTMECDLSLICLSVASGTVITKRTHTFGFQWFLLDSRRFLVVGVR